MTTDSDFPRGATGLPRTGIGSLPLCAAPAVASGVIGKRRSATPRPSGFTLIETALVLIVIALLVGGILKGWHMIQSARVRTLAETASAVQSAYFAFSDRYGRVAGDWNAVDAGNAIGATVNGGGNDSGRLDTTAGDPWTESNAFWEQQGKAGFILGNFDGAPGEPSPSNLRAPLNPFNRPILIGRTSDFEGATTTRRHIIVGRGAPAGLLRELDVKLDDGKPHRGKVRATVDDAGVSVFGGTNRWGGRDTECINAVPAWDATRAAADCNALLIF